MPFPGNAQLKYHRNADHDDVLANLSRISIVSEEHDSTVEVPNEREFDRPIRQRRPPPVSSNYKTRMCMTYASGKQCEMGNRCKFAHGPEELRVAEPCAAPPRQGRNPPSVGNGPQNVCDVTPETVCEAPPVAVTRSAVKPAAEKILLRNRNIAGSMVCLATVGRREQASDDSAIGSGSSECGASLAHAKALARARDNVPSVPIKFLRRRSMSQFTLKRFNSSENLDVAASCSQLTAIDHNRGPISMFSPLK
ncbi:hypothetical protein OESDEN_04168 [Oesophagostomum dentatum]|uniref:C3H1-type domain-containing protein n=1 Tax=Oesophagostomum dentatum TaxID=61180 RepID=A0A0B1TJ73_OESDE|nr:hypothetical protein OESDEN_04168 [Oesophagostomum dentatum]